MVERRSQVARLVFLRLLCTRVTLILRRWWRLETSTIVSSSWDEPSQARLGERVSHLLHWSFCYDSVSGTWGRRTDATRVVWGIRYGLLLFGAPAECSRRERWGRRWNKMKCFLSYRSDEADRSRVLRSKCSWFHVCAAARWATAGSAHRVSAEHKQQRGWLPSGI